MATAARQSVCRLVRKRALIRDDEATPPPPRAKRTTVLRNDDNNVRLRAAMLFFDDDSTLIQIVLQTGYDWMHVYYDDNGSEVVRTYGFNDTEQNTFNRAKANLAERGWLL